MMGQVLHGRVLAIVGLAAHAGRRRALEVARSHHLVEGALVVRLHGLLDLGVLHDHESPALRVAAVGRAHAGSEDLRDQRIGHRVGLQPSHGPHRLHDLEQVARVGHAVLLG